MLIGHGCSLLYSRNVFSIPKSIQATVILLENLHVILEKTPRDDIRAEVLPMLYNALESTTPQVQVRACGVLSIG
jgi:SCY1-like protein 2